MTIKKIIKETFQEELDSKKMREEILLKAEKPPTRNYKFAIPLCTMVFVLGFFLFPYYLSKKSNHIIINQLEGTSSLARMSNNVVQELDVERISFPFLKDIVLPDDFKEEKESQEYRLLEEDTIFLFSYQGKENRKILITVGENRLSRSSLNEDIQKQSKINGHSVSIYCQNDTYLAVFEFENYYFDIETNNVSKKELITLLKSILL